MSRLPAVRIWRFRRARSQHIGRPCSPPRDVCSSPANMPRSIRDLWKVQWKAVNGPQKILCRSVHPAVELRDEQVEQKKLLEQRMSEARKYFWEGVRAELPLMVGGFPFGMIYGALALNAGLSNAAAQMMSSIVFAGSAQFVAAQLVQVATPAAVIILTIAVVNVRHMLYSASLAPYLKDLSLKWKVLLSYLLTDEAYAPSIIKYEKDGVQPFSHWFVFGAGLALWIDWQVSTAVGILLAAYLTDNDILKIIP